ncbi:lovastatin nonaketide synthase [Nannizzia gypsea CBS 118893]|uniref:Non-reducing polyketide synthase nscA n=1 Tax=Arthroderma gypseum (strain ATCC MYA-4604 / CBS 118893) TaxID=535722 RepID=E4UW63_ARTGP|nr:lovastatin nonaketide synthase [Nannizzia gypsea CBS 118893]EFR01671.1 lovastatin nonaketide synthase [Nannizzia gypsea CBS 118893]
MAAVEPIAIIGSACRFPGDCDTPSKLWELLKSPRDLLRQVPPDRYNADAFYHPDPNHHGTTNVRQSYFLNENPTLFDNGFFNIPASEAEAIDPQQRMLMETVYDSLCTAGQTIEGLRGSSTAVYVGVMCDDWSTIVTKDLEVFPKYGATGISRSIISNRVSYFFDWHGPCMTIDTACSSSLVAVHLAIQTLRSGESDVAIAAGANLILTPGMYVAESKLSMLSASGRSRMWDKDVDGYARGEGIASVVLKPLSAAIRDNDHIECIIRGTGVNQDGRTPGLTMPSATAQAALIQSTYARAGLDINKPEDRPQFFHAHGTGTPAGDPKEAEAIFRAFYATDTCNDTLFVGSIKTVVGHTEGTAGLASLISTSLALQNGIIPPNMHFDTLNPQLAPFYHNLKVPTCAQTWPRTHADQPRRASINSFGFGGTNAHAILEAYEPKPTLAVEGPLFTPLTFSASSEVSLRSLLSSYDKYLRSNQQESLHDLAYSLQSRRSTLPYRVAIAALTTEDARSQIDAIVSGEKESSMGVRHSSKTSPKILGVFTGQGAQWPRMGARLLEGSSYVARRFAELDQALSELPPDVRPAWTLQEMVLADINSSRVSEAEISQPLCTAVQIVLVDLLRLAGITLHAVVGHSSGEIGAAYAAGFLTAHDAIRIAYYRGVYTKLAKSPNGGKGAMMAAGTTFTDASELCELDSFKGRIQVAARNSPLSITLSGDEDAIIEAINVFKDEDKFARRLNVDTAYHSSHILPCSGAYLTAMDECGVHYTSPSGPNWYSSVREGKVMAIGDIDSQYWVDNMISPVLFYPALVQAAASSGPFDLVVEIGPHPALKSPCLDTLEEVTGERLPYVGLLSRTKDDIHVLSSAFGSIWSYLGAGTVSFDAFNRAMSPSPDPRRFLRNLPQYPFDRRRFMSLSRLSGLYNSLQDPPHPLLGRRCQDRETSQSIQWRNILHPKEISWLAGHKIQGQIVFPATGYIAMAVEAIAILARGSSIGLITIEDFDISRAMAFNDDGASVEIVFGVNILSQTSDEIYTQFSCHSGGPRDNGSAMALNANGKAKVLLENQSFDRLPKIEVNRDDIRDVAVDRFYESLNRLGYNYSSPFRGINSIQRKADYAIGTLENQSNSEWEDQLIVHPGMLDTALQSTFAAYCCPGDERMWALHVPTNFRRIVINPHFTLLGIGMPTILQYEAFAKSYANGSIFTELNLLTNSSSRLFLHIEDMRLVPLSPAVPANDIVLFSRFDYQAALPDGDLVAADYGYKPKDIEVALDCGRIAFYYLRQLIDTITVEEKAKTLPHYRHLLDWAEYVVPQVMRGENSQTPQSAVYDTKANIDTLLRRHYECSDVRLLESVGENLPQAIRERSNILEHMTKDGMLDSVYEDGFGLNIVNEYIARMVSQITHRYPRMNILEIGAGTGGSTRRILPRLGSAFSTYTYTDISAGFFGAAQDRFKDYADRMIFKTFDMTKTPASQGFIEGSYDLVIASNVLHATQDLENMMNNVRNFLKPGGYLIILETVSNESLRVGLPMGSLPGWWLGIDSGRRWGPTLTLPQWDSLLRKSGFGGIDTETPTVHKLLPGHVFCSQALDDRIGMLRSPLTDSSKFPATRSSTRLVIIGGKTLRVHRICEQISSILAPRFSEAVRMESIEAFHSEGLAESSTILCLTELDEPLFTAMTPTKLDAMKILWRQSGNILWVTTGARAENPHCYMTVGLGRCMRFEYPNITLQMLDIDVINRHTPQLIAENLIRLGLLKKWSKQLRPGDMLWSVEPEFYIENDMILIPRLYPYEEGNRRYNASRRTVNESVNPQEAKIIFTADSGSWEAQYASPLHIPTPLPFCTETRNIRITQFLLSTVRVLPGCNLMLCLGIDTASKEKVLAATHITESPVTIPTAWTIPIDNANPVQTLGVAASRMVASNIMKLITKGESLVIHNPHPLVAKALKEIMTGVSVSVTFTTSNQSIVQPGWHHIYKGLPKRHIRELLPSSATKFIDFSSATGESSIGSLIVDCLPRYSEVVDSKYHLGANTEFQPWISLEEVSYVLKQAFLDIKMSDDDKMALPIVQTQDISYQTAALGQFSIADCSGSSLDTVVRPIDEGNIFRHNMTYFLVGLSGEIGQSLCRWMVTHGARYVVLTSRRPKVSKSFMQEMAQLGADVMVSPMDITSRESLHTCYESIKKSMPPIAGVANGAMVLKDSLFDKMSYEDFNQALRPKVIGSKLLDELFYDSPLDFFICFSSLTGVVGNSGQSNYTAGNMFMTALTAQRKKRGVAASCIDISSVIGIGYVERSDDLSEDTFTKMGYRPISEQDLQLLFAEAIILGRPDFSGVCELTTGVSPIYTDIQAKDQYLKDVKFGHFMMERVNKREQMDNSLSLPVRVQLAELKSKVDAALVIKNSFITQLRRILAIPPSDTINEQVTLVEQGVDSLMAVEIRSWFIKELEVDIPVLKILGGSSISDLLEEAIDSLPAPIASLLAVEAGEGSDRPAMTSTLSTDYNSLEKDCTSYTSTPSSTTGERQIATPYTSTTPEKSSPGTPMKPWDISPDSIPLTQQKPLKSKDNGLGASFNPPGPPANQVVCDMSFGQAGFWFLSEYLANKKASNMAVMLKLTGPISVKSLEAAVHAIGNRHEILRTRFSWSGEGDGRMPMQVIETTSAMRLTTKPISSESDANAELQNTHNETWDLTSGDVIRISLLTLSDQVHFLIVGMHHIFMDGYSFSVFFKDLEAAYRSETLAPVAPESQYRHFAAKQRQLYETGAFNKAIAHYRKTFAIDLKPIELLPFAKSKTRQAVSNYTQHEATISIGATLAAKLRRFARQSNATTFHVYLGALQALLFRLLPTTDDIFIGIADAGRLDKNFMSSVGLFLNLLPLHFHRDRPGTLISSAIQSARSVTYSALQYSQLPFDVLLRELNVPRSNAYTPIFQVFMDYRQVVQDRSTWCGCKIDGENWCSASTGYDIALEITEKVNGETSLTLRLQDALYSDENTQLLLRSYTNALEFMVDAGDKDVDDIPAWSPHDTQAALEAGKAPVFQAKWPQTIVHRIESMIRLHGSRVALKDGNGNTLNYEQMSARVDTICNALQVFKMKKGSIVGVFQEPSTDWICSMLAIFKVGAVYVPLDLRNSIPRLAAITRAARPILILTDNTTTSKVQLIDAGNVSEVRVSSLGHHGTKHQANEAEPNAQAMILFTSGSTGEPKGLLITHANIVASIEASSRIFAAANDTFVVLQQSPFSFDCSLDQIFSALANGGCLYVVPDRSRGDPIGISQIMLDEGVTNTTATPSEYDMWLRYGSELLKHCTSWRYAFSGGEAMSVSLARGFAALSLSGLRLYNGYGPAETTIYSTKGELEYTGLHLQDPLPAGFMLPGFSVCITDSNARPVPLGVPGEIVIGGPCVISGYLDNEGSTKQKFVSDDYFETSSKVYRTGDRGRLLVDGTLFCDGRLEGDTQIKLRGFRIELMEIETALIRHSGGALSHAVVTLRGSGESRFLAAHVVFSAEYSEDGRAEMIKYLRHSLPLPQYMQPSIITILDDIPRTSHHKIDRKAIQIMPLPSLQENIGHSENLRDVEQKLSGLWREIIPVNPGPLDAESDFFQVGGDSILLVKLQALIREEFLASPKLVTLMAATTLGAMATVIENSCPGGLIDWKIETQLPEPFQKAKTEVSKWEPRNSTFTILLTGATGYLGRHLLSVLANDPKITEIVSLVRHIDNEIPDIDQGSSKVRLIQADVSKPGLGISDDEYSALAEKLDIIFHCAANRSFWDRYEVLRPDNFDSVKGMVRLAARRSIPLHVMSSGGVALYTNTNTQPPRDGSDGYVSTKWAAEAFLQRAAPALELPVYIHRPVGVPGEPTLDNEAFKSTVLQQLTEISRKLGTRPSFESVRGSVDILPVDRIVFAIHQAVILSTTAPSHHADNNNFVQIIEHEATLRIFVEDFKSHIQKDHHLYSLPSMPILEWFGKAKLAGFGFFIAAQDLLLGRADGMLVSRR